MNINEQARESAAKERQHNKLRENAMDVRTKAEAQQDIQSNESVSEAAREAAASQRKAEEAIEEKMHRRVEEGT